MNQLTALIHNFNTNCYKQYTNVSEYLGGKLDKSLQEIEKFYYSEFWENRFKRRLQEENLEYNPIELDIIQGTTTILREDTKFKLFNEDQNSNGVSNNDTMIALNVNMSKEKLNDSHINNIIMHEFGHRQYNQETFNLIIYLNNKCLVNIKEHIIDKTLTGKDLEYFTNSNELRQRIIPIVKEMYDNNWNAEEVYDKSKNLEQDDIKDIFTKSYILYLINNLL